MIAQFVAKYLALTAGYAGLCLGYTRRVLGAPAKYRTAYLAWKGARLKVIHDSTPPAGVPVFFQPTSNGFGHVAPSIGGGRVRSTNSATGKITNRTIVDVARYQPLLGYSYDLNGVFVGPQLDVDLKRGSTGDAVQCLQARLTWAGHPLRLDGVFGAQTANAVRAFQKANKLVVDGIVGPKTRKPVNKIR